jgi:hypothetical protein
MVAVIVIGGAFLLSVFPIPDAPWCYLPYIFACILALGMLLSWHLASKIRAIPGEGDRVGQKS